MTTDIQVASDGALVFSAEQRQLIRDTFANGASDQEFAALLEVARARRLNPFLRQIHFVSRWDSQKGRAVWATQVSIDGLRAIAQRTGLYDGQDEPEFVENPDGSLRLCRVRVYRKDWQRPAVGIAFWEEYVQTIRDKQSGKDRPAPMWRKMPHVMLAKVSEALALRKAFPEDTSGLYTGDEMGQAENDAPVAVQVETTSRPRRGEQRAPVASLTQQLPAPPARSEVVEAVAEVMTTVGGDNPTLGEHNTAVREGEARAANAAESLIASVREQLARCELPGEVAKLMNDRSADMHAGLDKVQRKALFGEAVKRAGALGQMPDKAAETWLTKAVADLRTGAANATPTNTPRDTFLAHVAAAQSPPSVARAVIEYRETGATVTPDDLTLAEHRVVALGIQPESAATELDALIREIDADRGPRPDGSTPGSGGPGKASQTAAKGSAANTNSGRTNGARAQHADPATDPRGYFAAKGSRTEIERAVRAHHGCGAAFLAAAVNRLDAITEPDHLGARPTRETLARLIETWRSEGARRAAETQHQVKRAA